MVGAPILILPPTRIERPVIKSNVLPLRKLLRRYGTFTIPAYQRPYSWKRPQFEMLWEDLAYLCDHPDHRHFLGPLVVQVEARRGSASRDAELIDGQQRTTTLLILVALLRDRLALQTSLTAAAAATDLNRLLTAPDAKPKLSSKHGGSKMLDTHILPPPGPGRPQIPSPKTENLAGPAAIQSKNMRACAKYLNSRIEADLSEHPGTEEARLHALIQAILHRTDVLVMEVTSEESAYAIFETLNDRGIRLTQADRLKSSLVTAAVKDGEPADAISTRWDGILGRLKKDKPVEFLSHYLLISNPRVQSQMVSELFRAQIKKSGALTCLNSLDEMSQWYEFVIGAKNHSNGTITAVLRDLRDFKVVAHNPLLMVGLAKLSEERPKEFEELCRRAESLSFRWVVCGKNAEELKGKYQSASAAYMLDGVAAHETQMSYLADLMPDDEQFKRRFAMSQPDVQRARYVLRRIEQAIAGGGKTVSHTVEVEHIAPQKPGATDWRLELLPPPAPNPAYERIVAAWGNLTLLDKTDNGRASNQPWSAKQPIYQGSEFGIAAELAGCPTWSVSQVAARTAWLSEMATLVWPCSSTTGPGSLPLGYSHWTEQVGLEPATAEGYQLLGIDPAAVARPFSGKNTPWAAALDQVLPRNNDPFHYTDAVALVIANGLRDRNSAPSASANRTLHAMAKVPETGVEIVGEHEGTFRRLRLKAITDSPDL